jgi:hypothetical protein
MGRAGSRRPRALDLSCRTRQRSRFRPPVGPFEPCGPEGPRRIRCGPSFLCARAVHFENIDGASWMANRNFGSILIRALVFRGLRGFLWRCHRTRGAGGLNAGACSPSDPKGMPGSPGSQAVNASLARISPRERADRTTAQGLQSTESRRAEQTYSSRLIRHDAPKGSLGCSNETRPNRLPSTRGRAGRRCG